MDMKRVLLIAYCFLQTIIVYAELIEFKPLKEYKFHADLKMYELNGNFYFSGSEPMVNSSLGLFEIKLDTFASNRLLDIYRLFTDYDDALLVKLRRVQDDKYYAEPRAYDVKENRVYKNEIADWIDNTKTLRGSMVYYQNDQFIGQTDAFDYYQFTGSNKISLFDYGKKSIKPIELGIDKKDGLLLAISPDKNYIILANPVAENYTLLNTKTYELEYNFGQFRSDSRWRCTGFLTNNLVLSPSPRIGRFNIFQIDDPQRTIDIEFEVNGNPISDIWFSHDLTKAIVAYGITIKKYMVDATPFRNYLESRHLLFQPTAGVLNDSSVRLRENPNLKAKTLGFLNKGDKVTVLDRSGIKVAIGDMKDYWYKVITKEEKTGWSYGAFIDLVALETIGPVGITHISASSTLTDPLDKNMYQPIKAFDSKPDTAWVENAAGPGAGSTISVELEQSITIDRIKLMPGWFEKKYWTQFYRIKRMGIQLDDYKVIVNLKDTMEPQEVRLEHPVTFKRAKFMIRMVYPTTKWEDTALAEVEFYYKDHKIPLDISKFKDQLKVEPEEDN